MHAKEPAVKLEHIRIVLQQWKCLTVDCRSGCMQRHWRRSLHRGDAASCSHFAPTPYRAFSRQKNILTLAYQKDAFNAHQSSKRELSHPGSERRETRAFTHPFRLGSNPGPATPFSKSPCLLVRGFCSQSGERTEQQQSLPPRLRMSGGQRDTSRYKIYSLNVGLQPSSAGTRDVGRLLVSGQMEV